MAVNVSLVPFIVVIALIIASLVYAKTKSKTKVAGVFQILFSITVILMSTQFTDGYLIAPINLLAVGLLINGLVFLLKKK
jgi:hypothetical protein